MYSTADAALVIRDTAIPGLRLLLDDEQLTAALANRLTSDVKRATSTYLRYKPGTSCTAAVTLETAGGPQRGFVRAERVGGADKVDKQLDHAARNPAEGAGPVLLGPETVYAPLAHDRALPALRRLRDAHNTERLLDRALPSKLRPDASLSEVRYKPGRRFVARVDGPEGPRAVIKCYAAGDYAPAVTGAYTVARAQPGRMSRPVTASDRYQTLTVRWVKGRSLTMLLRKSRVELATLMALGETLAQLHRADPGELAVQTARDDLKTLRRSARLAGRVLPQLARPAARVATQLGGALAVAPRRRACLHGDFSADQVLINRSGPVMIDFDHACVGDPVADLGRFAAALEHDVVGGLLTRWDAQVASAGLIAGYVDAGGADPSATLGLWTGTWLVRTLVEPFRFRRPDWVEEMAALLARAESMATWLP